MELCPTGRDTEVVESGRPERCVNGHPLGRLQVIVGHLPCICAWPVRGHRTFTCRTCGVVEYQPAHDIAAPRPSDHLRVVEAVPLGDRTAPRDAPECVARDAEASKHGRSQ